MCGIVAVIARPSTRRVPDLGAVVAEVQGVAATLLAIGAAPVADLEAVAARLEAAERELRGTPGLTALLPAGHAERLLAAVGPVEAALDAIDADLDAGRIVLSVGELEAVNAALVRLRDAWWALSRDRVRAAEDVAALIGPDAPEAREEDALLGWWSINVALTSIDRLEVRGRDSAGIHVLVTDHGLDLDAPEIRAQLNTRAADDLFRSTAARTPAGALSLVYKAAAEIGELGDNVRALRAAVASDALLHLALAGPQARCVVLGHTRWASVGVISEANAHPLNSEELDRTTGPYVTAALNGDVDNHADLKLSEALSLPAEITTDAKVIPTLVSRRLAAGEGLDEAFRATVARFDGSVAIGVSSADHPDEVHLALRGSGQSLNIGLAENAFVVASEPYGLVEETSRFLRMDGESTQGQVVVLERAGAGTVEGLRRLRYDGAALPVEPQEIRTAEITTRDIDRGGFSHFLIKEVSEAPGSFRKTLRGKIHTDPDGRLTVGLGPEVLPAGLVDALAGNEIRRILVVGQGTAAVAGRAVAAAFAAQFRLLAVSGVLATELSGFGLSDDMSDTLVVAVSQSGTTTDTNRTVDLVRSRRAWVLAVVNRRNSDLVTKAHGTIFTSDGRDVEMSVASTKAFYSQVAAGWLLAVGLAVAVGIDDPVATDRTLRDLRALPDALDEVLAKRDQIGRAAATLAPARRYWTVVGSGPDAVAAAEVRIKLSELCYRSIACDTTEDKKHIDLSCEPLILVCASGLSGPNADDTAKDVAIFRAHKAAPVVIAAAGETARYRAALEVIEVPVVAPALAFVLAAMVGHLFGYESAIAIDAQALPLRQVRASVEAAVVAGAGEIVDLQPLVETVALASRPFRDGLRAGAYNGNLEPSTAVRLVSLLNYVTGVVPIEGYELEAGRVGSPGVIVADLLDALSDGIDELTRPVDAIKHQAKTVTVGTSRNEDALLAKALVKETLAVGATSDLLGYRALRTLAQLDPAVLETVGYARYRIDWPAVGSTAWPSAEVIDRGGIALGILSRTETDPRLLGTKHRAAEEREVTVSKGASDGRTVIMIPEVKANTVTGMTLLHVRLADTLEPASAREVLTGYRGRYAAIRDAVTETVPAFDDEVLGRVPLVDLLTRPVHVLAAHWRRDGKA
jgi:glutamine---fructose-6-phosphate transaminase (isomerizing)